MGLCGGSLDDFNGCHDGENLFTPGMPPRLRCESIEDKKRQKINWDVRVLLLAVSVGKQIYLPSSIIVRMTLFYVLTYVRSTSRNPAD